MIPRRHLLLAPLAFPAAAQTEQAVDLHITAGLLPPDQRRLTVTQGNRVRLRITSDQAGELHLHAFRLSVKLQPGSMAELAVTARGAGRFPLEWHAAGSPPDAPHAAPLAVLEVQPR